MVGWWWGGGVCKVIFMSNPTVVLRLGWGFDNNNNSNAKKCQLNFYCHYAGHNMAMELCNVNAHANIPALFITILCPRLCGGGTLDFLDGRGAAGLHGEGRVLKGVGVPPYWIILLKK